MRRQIGCNLVQWTSIDTGNCHVTYTIQYENETGIIGIISGIDDSNQSWCSKPYSGATSIRMWAVYSGNIGTKSPAIPLKDMSNNSVKSSGKRFCNFIVLEFQDHLTESKKCIVSTLPKFDSSKWKKYQDKKKL